MPRRAQAALLGAGAGVLALALTWYAAFHVLFLARADTNILTGFAGLQGPFVNRLAQELAGLADPKPFLLLAAALVLVALLRRRGRVAAAAAGVLLGAGVTTQLLKAVLHDQHPVAFRIAGVLQVGGSSWPSGHATAAMSLALCAILVTRSRWRPRVAAAGAAFAVAVCFSFLTLVWHYPSDVLGGFLVATVWTLLGVAAVWTADARWPRAAPGSPPVRLTARQALGPPLAAALSAVVLVAVVALARPHAVVAYAHAHKTFVVGAAAIGAVGLALATGLMLATTTRGRRRDARLSDSGPAPRAALRRR